jgi:competence protein ComEA
LGSVDRRAIVERRQWVGAGVIVVVSAGAGLWYAARSPEPPPVAVSPVLAGSGVITVHVAGAVRVPGLVEVPGGSRVADAIVAAGGVMPGADLQGVNLAAPLADGQQLVVPLEVDGSPGAAAADGRIRINVAGAAELEGLPGVGPVLAQRIVDYRDQHGPFTVVEDLLDVPGIGEAKLEALRESVLVP